MNSTINKDKKNNLFEICLKAMNAPENGCSSMIINLTNSIKKPLNGFSSSLYKKYPIIQANYDMVTHTFLKNNLGYCQTVKIEENTKTLHAIYVTSINCQLNTKSNHNPRPINYAGLTVGLLKTNKYIEKNISQSESVEIHCPKLHFGSTGGNSIFYENILQDVFLNRNVYVYENIKTKEGVR